MENTSLVLEEVSFIAKKGNVLLKFTFKKEKLFLLISVSFFSRFVIFKYFLTHFQPMFDLCRNGVVGFYYQNI